MRHRKHFCRKHFNKSASPIRNQPSAQSRLDTFSAPIKRDNNPLDIGAAARAACEKYNRDMSLRRFAELAGIHEDAIMRLSSASIVAEYIRNEKVRNIADISVADISNKVIHLYEISKAPSDALIRKFIYGRNDCR